MKIFLSWSGEASRSLAMALRSWLPRVIQSVSPWMSQEDVDKGSLWSLQLSAALEEAAVCLVCLTPDNLGSPWLHFEAGAVVKSFGRDRVCPYLFRVRKDDVSGPMALLQLTSSDREDTLRLVQTLNSLVADPLPNEILDDSFEDNWPKLERELKAIQTNTDPSAIERPTGAILSDVLDAVRGSTGTQIDYSDQFREMHQEIRHLGDVVARLGPPARRRREQTRERSPGSFFRRGGNRDRPLGEFYIVPEPLEFRQALEHAIESFKRQILSPAFSVICPCQAVAEFGLAHGEVTEALQQIAASNPDLDVVAYTVPNLVDHVRTHVPLKPLRLEDLETEAFVFAVRPLEQASEADPRVREIIQVADLIKGLEPGAIEAIRAGKRPSNELHELAARSVDALMRLDYIDPEFSDDTPLLAKIMLVARSLGTTPDRIGSFLRDPVTTIAVGVAKSSLIREDDRETVRELLCSSLEIILHQVCSPVDWDSVDPFAPRAAGQLIYRVALKIQWDCKDMSTQLTSLVGDLIAFDN